MINKSAYQQLSELLRKTAEAHHKAFIETNGEDKKWPKWYAKYLLDHGIEKLLRSKMAEKDIERLLKQSDEELKAQASKSSWENFYADHMLKSCEC